MTNIPFNRAAVVSKVWWNDGGHILISSKSAKSVFYRSFSLSIALFVVDLLTAASSIHMSILIVRRALQGFGADAFCPGLSIWIGGAFLISVRIAGRQE